METGPRHFLDLPAFTSAELRTMIMNARAMKDARKGKPKGWRESGLPLEGRVLAMIFEKPSTRTRVSRCGRSEGRRCPPCLRFYLSDHEVAAEPHGLLLA